MHLFELQFAWFFSGQQQLDYEKLASSIRQKTHRPFVSPAMFIPLPPGAPPEIPRVQMNTADNTWRSSVALNRADYFVATQNAELEENQISAFFDDIVTVSEVLLANTGIVRLGLVGRIFSEEQEPAKKIATTLLKKAFPNLQETSVKIVERHVKDTFTYNDSYQFDQGIRMDTQQQILIVTRDINTPPEIPLAVHMEMIRAFSSLAKERLAIEHITKLMEA